MTPPEPAHTSARLANLETFTWPNAAQPPAILEARDAYHMALTTFDRRYYRVHWWGDMPAGFTRITFLGETPEAFRIRVHTEPSDFETVMGRDELVLVFSDREGDTHADAT